MAVSSWKWKCCLFMTWLLIELALLLQECTCNYQIIVNCIKLIVKALSGDLWGHGKNRNGLFSYINRVVWQVVCINSQILTTYWTILGDIILFVLFWNTGNQTCQFDKGYGTPNILHSGVCLLRLLHSGYNARTVMWNDCNLFIH